MLATACGGGGSPLDQPVGSGRIVSQVGPGGGTLRGDGGTTLQGFRLEIPPGALERLVEIRIDVGASIDVPDTSDLSPSYRIQIRPDVGTLRLPALLEVPVPLPRFRSPDDLFVASRPPEERPTARSGDGAGRFGIAAEFGGYSEDTKVFRAEVRSLTDLQVRILDRARLPEDAIRLVQLGFESLSRLTDASVVEADLLFAEAQLADPFSPAANVFRAVSRVLVALNDRRDDTDGLDSVGEVLERIGFDVRSRSLAARLRTGTWPARFEVPATAPGDAEILTFLRERFLSVLELSLADLDAVPATSSLVVRFPPLLRGLPGDRELDAADVLFLRSLLAATVALVELAADLDLGLDANFFTRQVVGEQPSLEDALRLEPALGTLRSTPDQRTIDALRAALFDWLQAFELVAAETDDQEDDLLILPASFTPERFDLWRANVSGASASLQGDGPTRILLDGRIGGSLLVDFLRPLASGALDPRLLAPQVFRFLPLAASLPDPTFGGLCPEWTTADAIDVLGLVDRLDPPQAVVVADGDLTDWPAAAEALLPADPIADVAGAALPATDIERVFCAESADTVAFRLDLADGPIAPRDDQATVYSFELRGVANRSFRDSLLVEVLPTRQGPALRVLLDGRIREVAGTAAHRGNVLEVVLDRFGLYGPDEPVGDRAVRARAESVRTRGTVEAGIDVTRSFLIRL